ncbi:MAG: hypothetical protein ACF8Q5_01650 [Phycisphaerales bacterium JB040]
MSDDPYVSVQVHRGTLAGVLGVFAGFLAYAAVFAVVTLPLASIGMPTILWQVLASAVSFGAGFLAGLVCVRFAPRSVGAPTALTVIVGVLGCFAILSELLAAGQDHFSWTRLLGVTLQTASAVAGVVVGARVTRRRAARIAAEPD